MYEEGQRTVHHAKEKKKPGALGANTANPRDIRDAVPLLVELGPNGAAPHPSETAKTIRLINEVMEVGSANGIALQLYGPHIQPRHCVITNADGVTSLTPCHADAHTYVNGQRIHQTTILNHGNLVKFGNSNMYRFLDPMFDERIRHSSVTDNVRIYDSRSPRALSPAEASRENIETTFDLEGNVETISTASGAREDNRSLGSSSENRLSGMDRFPRGQDPILPAVLEFPEEPQEQFLARVITHLDVTIPTFRLAPAYTLYLCARYRASTHYRPELSPTERAHKLTVLLQHAATLIRHTVQDRSIESTSQAFWLANASELLHFLKSDRHVSAFSLQAQDTLADSVQLSFKNLVACLTDELNSPMVHLMSIAGDDHPREIINVLSGAMNLLRKCRVNAALTIQLFSQLFHWISAKALASVISNSNLSTRGFGNKLFNRLRNLQAWAESQGLELAAECHLAKIVQCAHLLQAPKYTPEDLAKLSAACFKLNSMQLGALLRQYKAEPGEKLAPLPLLDQAAKAAESVADELARAEGREVTLYEDPAPPLQLLLPDDGFSCDVVQGVPPGLADFLHPLQGSGLCRLAAQPTSSGHWTVYMSAPRPPSALSTTQPEVQVIRLHKAGGGMGLSIVAAKGAGQERLGIYIKSVVPGGAADRDGRLAAGDQLLSVDGQSLLGITQEKAAEFLVRTGSVVTLEVAKGGAVYHGLATLLQQPSPTPHRGPRRMSERDLPSRVDSERTIPSSKSVPALHHISPNSEQPRNPHDVFNPGYSRTSSNNSINTNSAAPPTSNGTFTNPASLRSRSTHNLNQQDGGFYQNLSIYRNKIPSPQQLGDRTSALRSSQNSLQSSVTNSQRPASAYYPPQMAANANRSNLHQSIPNLKSPPSMHRLPNDDSRAGSYPSVNQQHYPPNYSGQTYQSTNYYQRPDDVNRQYNAPNYQTHALKDPNSIYGPIHNTMGPYGQHIHSNGQRLEENRYNNVGGGLLREDVIRQSQNSRHEDIMKYLNTNNARIPEQQSRLQEEYAKHDIRSSENDEMIKNPINHPNNDLLRYASSGNIRTHESSKLELPLYRMKDEEELDMRMANNVRSQKFIDNTDMRKKQGRVSGQAPQQAYQQSQNYYHQHQQYYNNPPYSPPYGMQMSQNTQSMQNLNLNQQYSHYPQNQYIPPMTQLSNPNSPTSPTYKSPPIAPKPSKKGDDPPELPPTSTHPLYSASSQDPPKMAFYPTAAVSNTKTPRDPWAREEQERQAEVRREASRQWQEQQIRELLSLPNRSQQQEEQLRVLQLEREFQRRAMEVTDHDDEDTEKESPSSSMTPAIPPNALPLAKQEAPPTSILKPGVINQVHSQPPPPEPVIAPPPPERGSSFAVMSMRAKDNIKRVSFDTSAPSLQSPPVTLQLEETVREDPNSFIRQAESMLASPTTPTDPSGAATATPGVIGAQEVYRDPRARRLAEQAQQKNQTTSAVPEKLSFKEKMKMFAMETGEQETPKDKSKISRAQRDIDNLGSPSSGLVH